MDQKPVADVMTTEVVSVEKSLPMAQVIEQMSELAVSCVIVCEDLVPIGVISERDVVVLRAGQLSDEVTAADIMTSPVVFIEEQTGIVDAVALLRRRRIRRLPVTHPNGQLSGLITQSDLLDAYSHALESANATLEQRVAERTDELVEMAARFETLSQEDALLGIGNRRAMDTALDRISDLAMRYGRGFSVLLLDVDHFKTYNDTYGHGEGDAALVDVANVLKFYQRATDVVYRYGGEEFLVLLPETPPEGARSVAERLCSAVEEIGRPHSGSGYGVVTISCGVGTFHPGDKSSRPTIDRADSALYRAKENGRNRVELDSPLLAAH